VTPKSLMAIGAHADDIEINVGGTLLKYRDAGYDVVYVLSTNDMSGNWASLNADGSVTYRRPAYNEIMPQRKREALAGAQMFGTKPIHLNHPQRHFAHAEGEVTELRYGCIRPDCVASDEPTILTAHEHDGSVQRLVDLILEHNPEAVLTHGMVTMNIEHVGTCLLVTNAYWLAVKAGYDGTLLHWHDVAPGQFGKACQQWDTFVDVTPYWNRKLDALALHACQIPDVHRLDFPQRGDACGCEHAEVFNFVNGPDPASFDAPFSREITGNLKQHPDANYTLTGLSN